MQDENSKTQNKVKELTEEITQLVEKKLLLTCYGCKNKSRDWTEKDGQIFCNDGGRSGKDEN